MNNSIGCPHWLLAVLFFLFLGGCKDADGVRGKYLAESKKDPPPISIKLELGVNGQGSWSMREDRFFFRWETHEGEIWLHTKSGGVVVGRLLGKEAIEINLPGTGILTFKKVSK